jgi:alkanesulfonate monooxygenase SsuD/methylene tetrahydromethanopterin reductase-like flavin-dependent oxidoreductase (luciferase family)
MQIGLCLPTLEDAARGAPTYTEVRQMALDAAAAEFDSLWLYDHLLMRRWDDAPLLGMWESWTLLAALAEASAHSSPGAPRITLGTLVTCAAFRNPALLAKMAATLDEITQGHFILGLGAGWHEPEFTAFGYAFDHRVSRLDEALHIIRPLLKTGHAHFQGRYYRAEHCELRPRGPSAAPLLIGGSGAHMLALAARDADLWNTGYVSQLTTLATKKADIAAACAAIGRDPSTLALTVHMPVVYTDLVPAPPFLSEFAVGNTPDLVARWAQFAQAGVSHVMVECFPNQAATHARLAQALHTFRARPKDGPIDTP